MSSPPRTWERSVTVVYRKCCYLSPRGKSRGPGHFRQYPLGPWGVPFSQGFSLTELATTKSAKVTRDNEPASKDKFFFFALEARGPAWAQT